MDGKVSVWKANLNSGLIIGLLGIVFSLLLWFLDMTLKQSVSLIWIPILIVALYFGIKSYRDNYLKGFITYGQSLGAGVIIMLYYSIISAVFGYIFYSFIDPGIIDKMMALAEEKIVARGLPEGAVEQAMEFQAKVMKPWIMSLGAIINGMFLGTLVSLVVSIFTRKEGNPLIDDAIEE